MEDPKSAVVFEISSDEEADFGSGGLGGDVDFKWIRKLLDEEEDEKVEGFNGGGDSEDSDDLVVVDEVCGNRKQSVNKSLSDGDSDDDDDDCVMLDGDPDKPRGVEKENENGGFEDGSGDDSDDLVVVSEKGEVACRDFPHPRHLCAKFPFSSSRHEMHCNQCHCYVCDSLAPCVYWGSGVSSVDHCHATDKQAFWKSRRISLRSGEVPMPVPVATVKHFAISMRRPPMADQSLVPNLVQQNQVPRQFTVRPCSTPTNSVVPNVTRQGPRPGYVLPRSKFQTHLISQHLADTSPHVSVAGRTHNNLNKGPQRAQFKRTADAAFCSGGSGTNLSRPSYRQQVPTDPSQTPRFQGSRGRMTPVTNAYQRPYLSNVGETADMLSPQYDPILCHRLSNTMPPQMRSQQNRGTGNGNGTLLQNQMAAQQHICPGYTNYMPQASSHCPVDDVSKTSVPPHPLIGNIRDSFVSGARTTYQLDMGFGFMNTTPTPHQLTNLTNQNEGRTIGYSEPTQSQSFRQFEADPEYLPFPIPNVGSSSIDQFIPYQPPEYHQPMIMPDSRTNFEALSSNAAAVSDSHPVISTTPSTQLSGCNSHPQNAEQADYYSGNTNFYPQDPNPTDFVMKDLEAWLSVDPSVPNALGISAPLLNTPIPSPELASFDGGGLFID